MITLLEEEKEINLTIPTQEGEVDLFNLVAQKTLEAQPQIIAEFVAEWIKLEKELVEQIKIGECLKGIAHNRYRSAKILLHRLVKKFEWSDCYMGEKNMSPSALSLYQKICSQEHTIKQLQGEYYGTKCECGNHRTKEKHRNWLRKNGYLCQPECYENGRSCS